jgi:hypothetical protein
VRKSVPKPTSVDAAQLMKCPDGTPEFDYSSVSPSVAEFLRGQAARIQKYSTKAIIQIGKDLAGAKHYLSHGAFLRWVEDEVGIPARTAQSYMRVASWASVKSATVALLPPTALYALASSGVPKEFVEEVLRRVEEGERIQLPSLRAQIKALRETTSRRDNRSAGGEMDDQLGGSLHAHNTAATAALISDAVKILARALTAADFTQVREIITSKAVLDDPDLPRLLERAFGSYEVSDTYEPSGSHANWDQPIRATGKRVVLSSDQIPLRQEPRASEKCLSRHS